jgi:hypothetical protein
MSLKVLAMDRESIRRNFRPSKIRILFVGESPPANGAFFYMDSPMTNYMAQVFAQVCGKEFQSLNDFLSFFKAEGCYLDDLSYAPVDNLPPRERRQTVDSCVGALAERMKEYKPKHVVVVLMRIEASVRRAAYIAKLQVPIHAVPFPGQGNQARFVAELSEILKHA